MAENYLLCFPTAHYAMRAQIELEGKIAYQVIPTPVKISVSCGISLKIPASERSALTDVLTRGVLKIGEYELYESSGSGASAEYILKNTL